MGDDRRCEEKMEKIRDDKRCEEVMEGEAPADESGCSI